MRPPRRRTGHTAANATALGYLGATAVVIVVAMPGDVPSWLLVHLLLLGAATNAIITWSGHFASTLLQQPQLAEGLVSARLIAVNLGVIGVLVGVTQAERTLTVGSALLIAVVIALHITWVVRTVHAGRTRRFAPAVRFHWVAATALVLGLGAGATLAVGDLSVRWYERVFLAHVHLGLLGWVTLTVLGTEFTLWPTALRTRMVDGLERAARVCLPTCSIGLALLMLGVLTWMRVLSIVGLALYLAGVAAFLAPFLRTALRRAPNSPATVQLAASTGWLAAGLIVDIAACARDRDPIALAADVIGLVPWFLTGFVMQVLLGALSFLLPVVLGGPPRVGRTTAATVNRWGMARVVLLNAGTLLVALPRIGLARVGWLMVATALVAFVLLALAAVIAKLRAGAPAGSPLLP